MNKKQLILAWIIITLFIPQFCYSEDSGLKDVADSQGNVYSVDENGAIYSDGVPKPGRQPVSVENLGYYYNQALMLEVNGHIGEAMDMYHEIMCLPDTDQSVKDAKRAIGLRMKVLYNDEYWKSVVLEYFDVKQSSEGKFEISPKRER